MKKELQNVVIAQIWTKHYELCSFTNRTPYFEQNVMNFYDALIDLEGSKNIYTQVKEYYDDEYLPELKQAIEDNTEFTTDESTINSVSEEQRLRFANKLFRKIIQTIQDNGIAWQSTSRERDRYELSGFMGTDAE